MTAVLALGFATAWTCAIHNKTGREDAVQSMHQQLREIGELFKLDCGDSSCLCAAEKKGMRTNGGCRCDISGTVRRALAKCREHLVPPYTDADFDAMLAESKK